MHLFAACISFNLCLQDTIPIPASRKQKFMNGEKTRGEKSVTIAVPNSGVSNSLEAFEVNFYLAFSP